MKQESTKQVKISGYKLATLSEVASSAEAGQFAAKSKTSASYWQAEGRLFKFARGKKTKGATVKEDANYSCRISFGNRREQFQLHTAIKADAAKKAASIYRDVVGKGWEATRAIHKPKATPKVETLPPATVGSLIEASKRLSKARAESLDAYAKALRRITAGVLGIADGKKFDAIGNGRRTWLGKIDGKPLAALTPKAVTEWKIRFMKSARTPEERNRAAVTVNSLIRNAKALLSVRKKNNIRPLIEQEMLLPSPLFFDGIVDEEEPDMRYESSVDAEGILRAAQSELAMQEPEAFKLLLLTLNCGLRRSEADALLWSQFNFQKRVLVIADNDYRRLKSKKSAGSIDLEPELCALFQGFMAKKKSPFVLEAFRLSTIASAHDRKSRGYRCERTHQSLLAWLRKQGVKGIRPIHTMRKEIGSIIASRDGIWKASLYLRHSGIVITSKLYADKKTPVTSGLGGYLAPVADNVVAADFGAGSVVGADTVVDAKGKTKRRKVR
ncbi:MAG: tyrosine-type recombinase/integrase [Verrucomicrobia bacterium]|nr:tyrosine-type recombinase/integrase [Verrucomicrobiota bacterium]